ncbi:MAG: polysaccharide biosynthesis/export family protein [Desulfobacterota bacterium]|nr:polysaccharide biosynthesis/export family protein [Thermodesulfobacteriota bacterium]
MNNICTLICTHAFCTRRTTTIAFMTFIAVILFFIAACAHSPTNNHNRIELTVSNDEDAKQLKTLESILTVTPEKAALHPDYQTLEKIAVPYVPEYRLGPGDVIEVVYHINYDIKPESYRIEVQDKLSIHFPFHPQFNSTVTVRTDGKITLPIIGDVPAESKTPAELAAVLNKAYSAFMNNPSITVALEAFNVKIEEMKQAITTAPRGQSKIAPIGIDGRISFPIIGSLQAEGFTLSQLEKTVNERYSTVVRNLTVTLILLEIHHQKFYVLGEVKRQGSYEMTTRTNLLDALAVAEVDTKRAHLEDVVIFRNDGLERPIAFKVNVRETLKNGVAAANVPIKPADIIYVPKTKLDNLNDLIEKVFTKGIYSVVPFSTYFSLGEKDLGGDGGTRRY